jgi:hypothetical protein
VASGFDGDGSLGAADAEAAARARARAASALSDPGFEPQEPIVACGL